MLCGECGSEIVGTTCRVCGLEKELTQWFIPPAIGSEKWLKYHKTDGTPLKEIHQKEISFLDSAPHCPECGELLTIISAYMCDVRNTWVAWKCYSCNITFSVEELLEIENRRKT